MIIDTATGISQDDAATGRKEGRQLGVNCRAFIGVIISHTQIINSLEVERSSDYDVAIRTAFVINIL